MEERFERRSSLAGHRLERSRSRCARSTKTGSRALFRVLRRCRNSYFVRTNVRRMQRRKCFVWVVHLRRTISHRSDDRGWRTSSHRAHCGHARYIATRTRGRESTTWSTLRYVSTNPRRVRDRLAHPFVRRRRGKPFTNDVARRTSPRGFSRSRCIVINFNLRRRDEFRSLANESQLA